MSRIYREPPLIEAVCEFRFANNDTWDSTLPGLLYSEIRKEFPKKRDQDVVEMIVDVDKTNKETGVRGRTVPRIQFFSEDELRLVQIGPNLLSINVFKPYPKWPTFKALIFRIFGIYRKVAFAEKLERIGLRYVNNIQVEANISIRDVFNYYPAFPDKFGHEPAFVLLRTEHDNPDCNGRLIYTLASPQNTTENMRNYVLDLDFVTLKAATFAAKDCESWVEVAHSEIELTFEATITDMLRNRFREVANDHA